MVIRIRFSVPEGRTSKRPETEVSFSSNSFNKFSAAPDLKDSFCSGVASRLTIICGNLVMMPASSLKDFLVLAMTLVIMRAVR